METEVRSNKKTLSSGKPERADAFHFFLFMSSKNCSSKNRETDFFGGAVRILRASFKRPLSIHRVSLTFFMFLPYLSLGSMIVATGAGLSKSMGPISIKSVWYFLRPDVMITWNCLSDSLSIVPVPCTPI